MLPVAEKVRRSGRDTRQRIETEALRLFALKGVDGTSIRDIALAVGVADAALYRHFKSKDEIAESLFRMHYAKLAKDIAAISSETVDFPTLARRLIGLFCQLFDETPDVFRFLLMNQHAHLQEIDDDENVVRHLHSIMQNARDSGQIGIADADLAAAIALGAVVQPATFKLYGRLPGALWTHAETISKAVIRALGGRDD